MLTLKQLKKMQPDTIFQTGLTVDSPDGANITNSGQSLRYVAVRGGIHDWAIYVGTTDRSEKDIRDYGDKVHNREAIKGLVPCKDEALEMYRD